MALKLSHPLGIPRGPVGHSLALSAEHHCRLRLFAPSAQCKSCDDGEQVIVSEQPPQFKTRSDRASAKLS